MGNFSPRSRTPWLMLVVVLGGCASVDVHYPDGRRMYMSKAQFKAYAERVFRHQNQVVDQLIAADERGEPDARLLDAEETMEEACRPLITLVSAKAEHRALEISDKLAMPRAVPACEQAVAAVDALLSQAPPRP
jgi:hypothetical protein